MHLLEARLMKSVVPTSHRKARGSDLVSVVVPTYKEAENLESLITQISEVMIRAHRPYEIIVVDDDSRDGSDVVIAKLAGEGYPVRIITRVNERGLSSAVICGFQKARGHFLVCMDADLSHPPETIPHLLECLETSDNDFVIGSRYVSGGSTEETWGVFRWLNSKVATLLARPFTSVKDPMSGFFALPRSVFEREGRKAESCWLQNRFRIDCQMFMQRNLRDSNSFC
jgi:dolichol-phosphate mannosyltransferase